MNQRADRPRARLAVESLEDRAVPAGGWQLENFDSLAPGTIPAGWSQWVDPGTTPFGTSAGRSFSGNSSLAAAGASNLTARAWVLAPVAADTGVAATVSLTDVEPVQLLARGQGLDNGSPSYYALSITRGLHADLIRVVGGVSTTLASVQSAAYLSGPWVRITLQPAGSHLTAQVQRTDTGQYLTAAGQWQAAPTAALTATDGTLTGPGLVGINRPAQYATTTYVDDFTTLGSGGKVETFDTTPAGGLPAGWSQWSSTGAAAFTPSSRALSVPQGFTSTTTLSSFTGRAWVNAAQTVDVAASAALYLDQVIPGQVIVRGSNLGSKQPSYYAVSAVRGPVVQLVRVVNGTTTVLGSVTGAGYLTQKWVTITVQAIGNQISASFFRTDTNQYLTAAGQWQSDPAWAITVTDNAVTGPGQVGLNRPGSYAGGITFDDFRYQSLTGDTQPPVVTITAPAAGASVAGSVAVQATATDDVAVARVDFYVDGVLRASDTAAPYGWSFDTTLYTNGAHTLTVKAVDPTGNVGQASESVTVNNPAGNPGLPDIPQHLPNIRIAEFAFAGTPIDSIAQQLLQNDVDLVVSNPQYAAQIHQIAPNTPQLTYSNVSNIYSGLLTDWLNYADANGASREAAFFHVTQATPFTGNSASSQPVAWFWDVERGAATLTPLTSAARSTAGIAFGAAGESVYLGYTDRFREINLTLSRPKSGGWAGVWEYGVAGAGGNVTWSPLTLLADGTAGMTKSGRVTFDPPAGWNAASLTGGAKLFYVRLRTTAAGTAPVATVLGRDYVNAHGTTSGLIPAFDNSADLNHDGYLSDAEYANRKAGMDARFLSESRAFYPYYGQMRFGTNPSNAAFRAWAVDFEKRLVASQPLASGVFMDNSNGVLPLLPGTAVAEPTGTFARDFGQMIGAVSRAIAPKFVLLNTVGGWDSASFVIPNAAAWFEESALRPMSQNWANFTNLANLIVARQGLSSPSSLAVLDSLVPSAQVTDPRAELAALAEYYLVGDPKTTFFQYNGGAEPSTTWGRHWVPAAAYNIGPPTGAWSVWASGADPTNASLAYKVMARTYQNALVLYKPLSYTAGVGTGTTADATATWHDLGGTYRPLNADGTLGAAITRVSLRNGEGAILVKVTS
jgi:hypothetical protein